MINPPSTWNNLCIPSFWSAYREDSSFFQSSPRDRNIFFVDFDNSWRCSSVIRVHVEISWFHIPFDKKLILVRVSSRNHKETLCTNEPIKLFEPKHFSSWYTFTHLLLLFLFYFLHRILLSNFEDLLTCFFCPQLFLVVLLLTFVVHCSICVCIIIDVYLDWKQLSVLLFLIRIPQKNSYLPF